MSNGDSFVCPECDGPVDPATDQFCPRCGYPVATTRRPAAPPASAAPPVVAAGRPGVTDEQGWPDEVAEPGIEGLQGPVGGTLTCPSCGHSNASTRVRCTHCGTAVGTVATLVELSPSASPPQPRLARDRWPVVVTVLAVVAVLLAISALVVEAVSSRPRAANRPDDVSQETVRVSREIVEAHADNRLKSAGGLTYFACNVLDDDRATAWNSESGRGVGSQLLFRFSRPVELRSIAIVNGYAKDEDRFRSNSAVTRATVSAGGKEFLWPINGDTMEPQVLTEDFGRVIDLALRVDQLRPGRVHSEVAITDIWFEEAPPTGASATAGTRVVDVSCPPAASASR